MKKLILILLALTWTLNCYADSKPTLVYDKKTGDVIAVGYFAPEETEPTQGVEYLSSEVPKDRLNFYKRTGKGKIELKSEKERQDIVEAEKPLTDIGFMEMYDKQPDDKSKEQFLLKTVAKLAQSLREQDLK